MKKRVFIIIGILLTTSGALWAQDFKVSSPTIVEKESNVTVSFTADILPLSSDKQLTLTPVLYSDSGMQELSPIVVVGRNRAITNKRLDLPQGMLYKKGLQIPYMVTIPYERWMAEVSLRVDRQVCSCCSDRALASRDVTISQLIHYDITPIYQSELISQEPTELEEYNKQSPFLYPTAGDEPRDESRDAERDTLLNDGVLDISFRQNSSSIDTAFKGNTQVLSQVNEVLRLIQADSTATLEKIVILGFSSPEGALDVNERIAKRRADSFKESIKANVKDSAHIFEIISMGEDWDGLVRLVKASNMQYKQEVLDIIEKYDVLAGREKRLMDLKWGRPYRYMMEHFFPLLRNVAYKIYYKSKPDTTVAHLNRAIEMLNNKRYGEALELLGLLNSDATTSNLMGVASMMMDDYGQATLYFQKAIEQGSLEAAQNIDQMRIRQSLNQ